MKYVENSEKRDFFEDFSRVTGGAFKAFSGAKTEMDALMRQQFENFCASLNMVTREDFDVLEGMLAKSREAEEALAERVGALEKEIALLKGGSVREPKKEARPAQEKTEK